MKHRMRYISALLLPTSLSAGILTQVDYCAAPSWLQTLIPEALANHRACEGYCEIFYPECGDGTAICHVPACYDEEGWYFCYTLPPH
ncbi:MAG: hypothetical protein Q9M35_10250 [Rhodothermus sp.]|nr:hypothetical protein [Rhodothermus sp.]